MATPNTPSNPNPSRPVSGATSNPHDVTRPLTPGSKAPAAPLTRPPGVDQAGVDHNRQRDAGASRSSDASSANTGDPRGGRREVSQPSPGSGNESRTRSGSAADMSTQGGSGSYLSPTSAKARHDASERRLRDTGESSERATQLRNERATNVVDPEVSEFTRRMTPAVQASASRLNAIFGRMGELVGAQPSTSVKPGENPDAKAKGEYERLRGLARLELDYLSSIGKSPAEPFPEPPAEPKLRL